MGVKIKARHVVKPAGLSLSEDILPLSELDQVNMVSHASVLYFYGRPTDGSWIDDPSKDNVIETLKDSLGPALGHFYPLAGRLSQVDGGRFQLECNPSTMGAEIIEATSSNNISDFGDFVDSSNSMFRDLLVHHDYETTPVEEFPLLSVQVTRFECGGICLGIQTSHVITDGRSAFHFLKEWARLARGEPLKVTPYLDRQALRVGDTMVDQEVEIDDVEDINSIDNMQDNTTEFRPPMLVLITSEQIRSLQKMANQDHEEEMRCRPYGRFIVIAAHVWRCMTMARELESHQITAVYVIADGRSKLGPPVSDSYFGNAVIPVKASSSVGDLISRPLSYACSKIREAISQLTKEYIMATINFYEKEESLTKYQAFEDRGDMVGSTKMGNDVWFTSWLNLLTQDLDFGWGNEIYAGPPTGLIDDKNIFILPHYPSNGSVKLELGSHYETFLKYFNYC